MGQCAREAAVNCKCGLDADMHVHRSDTEKHTHTHKMMTQERATQAAAKLCISRWLHVIMLSVTRHKNKDTHTHAYLPRPLNKKCMFTRQQM